MLGRRCRSCRRALDADATSCPYCGASASVAATTPAAATWSISSEDPGARSTYETAGGVSGRIPPTGASAPSDRRALRSMAVGAVMATIAGLLGILSVVGLPFDEVLFSGTGFGAPPPTAVLALTGAVLAGAAAFSVAQALAFRSAFETLAFFDPRYARPRGLALLAVIGVLIGSVGWVVIVGGFYEAVLCAGSKTSIPATCVPVGPLLAGLALVGLGGLLAFVGYIGIAIGLWRAGSRYRSVPMRIGAILLLIPLVGTLGALLVLAGALRQRAGLT